VEKKINKNIIISVIVAAALILLPLIYVINREIRDAADPTPDSTQEPVAAESSPLPAPEPEISSNPEITPEPSPEPTPEPEPEDMLIDIAEAYPGLKDALDEISKKHNSVAVSLTFFDGEAREYYNYQYGYADSSEERPVDVDTKFRSASLSKLVTVICAMVLVDEGKLDLDRDISDYLDYEVRNPRYPDTPITSRMLMQHVSTIYDSSAFQSSQEARESRPLQELMEMRSTYRNRQPGTVFEYSNFGYSVIAAVCEKISGKMLDSFSREVLFTPLEIDAAYVAKNLRDTENIAVIYNSSHRQTRSVEAQLEIVDSGGILGHDHNLAQGGLIISALDYARILAMLGNGGVYNGERVLSSESVRAINYTNVQGRTYQQGLATRLTADLFEPGEDFFWHTGSAYGTFTQYMYSADDSNIGAVVLTTGATTGRLPNRMFVLCTDLSMQAWRYLHTDRLNPAY